MAPASLKDLYLDELAELCDAEHQMMRTLPRLEEAAHSPQLRATLRQYCEQSRLHLARLDLMFTHWGSPKRERPSTGLAGIVQEADNCLNQETTGDARDAAIIGIAQRMAHYEIAAYGSARACARRLNRPDEARLLQETLDEQHRTDHRLAQIDDAQAAEEEEQVASTIPAV